mmetsp:Transcript_26566/g.52171  ORF Transcript_26566/g.52171 Transcript_26566/m.52171 type:complete len:94 (+) Transcript_26566:190-471(+)
MPMHWRGESKKDPVSLSYLRFLICFLPCFLPALIPCSGSFMQQSQEDSQKTPGRTHILTQETNRFQYEQQQISKDRKGKWQTEKEKAKGTKRF